MTAFPTPARPNPTRPRRAVPGTPLAVLRAMNPTPDPKPHHDKTHAMKRGLRMAAKVAAVAGLLAAGAHPAAASEPAQLEPTLTRATTPTPTTPTPTPATDLAQDLRLGGAKGCGCAPCWGPPAPPAMSWLAPRDEEALA